MTVNVCVCTIQGILEHDIIYINMKESLCVFLFEKRNMNIKFNSIWLLQLKTNL